MWESGQAPHDAAFDHRFALQALGISHSFGSVRVLRDVSISVRPGEILALLGPSGCGKTTLLRIAAGLEAIQQGKITINGLDIARPGFATAPESRDIGLVFQDFALFPHLNVRENIAFGLKQLPRQEATKRVRMALDLVGMSEFANAYPHVLSGGQQQRVALARAMAPEPSVMLLDEPFSGLDSRLRESVRLETHRIIKGTGTAAIIVTHDPEEAMTIADRIAVMNKGSIEQLATPDEVYEAPARAFVASFMGDVNVLEASIESGQACTPVGGFPAPGLLEGAPVQVLIRPEAITLSNTERRDHEGWVVSGCRFIGRATQVEISSTTRSYPSLELRVNRPGALRLEPGTPVCVSVDPGGAHVFPLDHGPAGVLSES